MPQRIHQQGVQRILWINRGETVSHQQKQGLEVVFGRPCPAVPQDWTKDRLRTRSTTCTLFSAYLCE